MLPRTCIMAIFANLKYLKKEQEIILLAKRMHKSCVSRFKFASLATVSKALDFMANINMDY
jgi:Fe2+ or Zn2+ uptake regulation protein